MAVAEPKPSASPPPFFLVWASTSLAPVSTADSAPGSPLGTDWPIATDTAATLRRADQG